VQQEHRITNAIDVMSEQHRHTLLQGPRKPDRIPTVFRPSPRRVARSVGPNDTEEA